MVLETIPPELAGTGIDTLIELIRPFFLRLSVLVGGIFGLYVILILARVFYERKKVHLLKDIRYDLDRLNLHYGISYSTQKKGILKRVASSFGDKLHSRKLKKNLKKSSSKKENKK